MVSSTLPVEMLVPHRAPMLLIDAVLGSDDTGLWAFARVTAGTAFVTDDRVSSAVGLEFLAQAAAAFFTLQSKPQTAAARPGMLIACPRLDADVPWFTVGDGLLLHVKPASRMLTAEQGRGLVKFSGDIYIVSEGATVPTEMSLPQMLVTERGVVRAELSVYL